MYTQCPDCSVAFRVTADVLKQAAGKVRCGGCGSAFNALEYLSEELPEKTPPKEAGAALPELKPEAAENDAGLPAAISAEQSAALLKTLDELAGSDIRIEDTGVEWRVLDDDEVGDAADDELAFDIRVEDQPEIDELLEDSPTPVDQFLTETPPQVEAPEIFADDANSPDSVHIDELRFDDNTPLPDDFDLDDEASYVPLSEPEPAAEEPAVPVDEDRQADLDLSEPDEWTDILDEFEELAEAVSTPRTEPTIADELASLGTLDDDEAREEALPDDTVIDDSFVDDRSNSDDEPLDMDSQFALQAEAMGIDLSGMHQSIEDEEASQEEEDLDALLDDSRIVDRDIDDLLEEELVDDATVGDLEFDDFETDETDEGEEDDVDVDDDDEPVADDELPAEPDDDDLEIDELDLEVDLAAAELAEDEDEDEDEDELVIPPLTEEEQTINMMIDQDLLAIAVEDKDGFASTIVLPDGSAEDKAQKEKSARTSEGGDDDDIEALRDTSSGFETIIMEGESIQTALDEDKLAANAAAAAMLADAAAAERASEKAARGGNRRYGMVAGVVVLALLLVGQYLHQSRETLATIPAFNNVVGPMYRALGQPLSPEWDITGWRFEATKGSTDENDEQLTIYSRIGNKSDTPLPYPLIGISLTDRFEETVGSRVLDPAEYLSNDLDPRKLVQPGNTFNAVITIQSPSEEATGFKLNVCYRESGGNLRCALDDFK